MLKKLVSSASLDREAVLVRSLVALLYAHWEGFVRNAGLCYLQYLSPRRLRYSELASNFVALSLLPRIRDAASRHNLSELIQVVELLRDQPEERCRMPKDAVDTESNLSSRVLHDLMTAMGLDYAPFETKAVLIDERLLGNRNRIAHGEYVALDARDSIELADQVLALMEGFRDQLENAVALSRYRKSA